MTTKRFQAWMNDAPTKIIALFAAVLLWIGVTFLGSRTETLTRVPVQLLNAPDTVGLTASLPAVTVRIRVPRSLPLPSDTTQLVKAFVDAGGSVVSDRTLPVTVTATDPTIEVLSTTPNALRVTLDPVVTRTLPVRVIPGGTPADGYKIGEVSASPERVEVRAPLGTFTNLTAIDAQVSVDNATTSIDDTVPLTSPDGVRVVPDRIRAAVVIEQAEGTKTVGIRVVTKGTPASGYFVRTITTDPLTLFVHGPKEALDALSAIDTSPLDITNAQASVDGTPTLSLPEGVATDTGNSTVKAHVDIGTLEGTKTVNASVEVQNVPAGLRVESANPSSVQVTLRGDQKTLQTVQGGDVKVVLSANGKNSGVFSIQPTVEMVQAPSGVGAVSVENKSISVNLQEQ